jgi:putative transposase
MGRPHRIQGSGIWYHVVNRGAARERIFFDERDRTEFLRLLGVVHERFGVRVHAYCLMTNHYHLFVECPEGGISEAMHLVGSVYVRHTNERLGRDGPLFTDRFYAKPVTEAAYALRLVRYIHQNPLAFVPPDRLREYRWSSLRTYLGDRRVPAWLEVETVLEMFGGERNFAACMFDGSGIAAPVGSDAWCSAVELMIDEHLGDRARQGAVRTVLALLIDRLDDAQRDHLDEAMRFPSDAARRTALSRARRQAREHPELQQVVSAVIELLR